MSDLFAAAAADALERQSPLADRLRPQRLDDVVGQEHLLGRGKPLRSLIEADRLSSVILWGPPGTGKTTLSRLIARSTAKAFVQLSAVTATVKDVREEVARAEQRLGERGQGTILFLDEVHRFNKAQQDTLLPSVESGLIVLIGATTENPYFEVNAPLLSRSTLFVLQSLDDTAIEELVRRGAELERVSITDEAVGHLVAKAEGDGRQSLTSLEVAAALAQVRAQNESQTAVVVELADAEAALGTQALRYGRDEHYDTISAFIKSIRGSDPDASLFWLARMLDAGEDARFIARRLVILASEDVGLADSMGLLVAEAAARAVEYVGLPEAQLNLSHAVLYLATAPKSNSATKAIFNAKAAAREAGAEIPTHLRDSHYQGAKGLGHGDGYKLPHNDPRGYTDQEYRPPQFAGQVYYSPSQHGDEAAIAARLAQLRGEDSPDDDQPGGPI